MTTPGLHELHWYILATCCESRLVTRPLAHVASRDSDHATYGCRDVTDGAPRSSVEAQGARSTSSGGAQSLYIVSTYPYHVYSGPGPVTGASTGRRDGLRNPGRMAYDQGEKGVNHTSYFLASVLNHANRG